MERAPGARAIACASEAAALGLFMVAASSMTVLLEHPSSPVRGALPDAFSRRALMGLSMGLTAAALIYSPLGHLSGAHMNPAVTLTFLRLGRIAPRDATGYVAAQFLGGWLGAVLAASALRPWIAHPAVNHVATMPGALGAGGAFGGELVISFVMMLAVLAMSSDARRAPLTGLVAGALVATFITVEAPLSGMSMNPARTLGPDLVRGLSPGFWIYATAPLAGMLAAAETFARARGLHAVACATLHHDHSRCVFGCLPRAEVPGPAAI
jgi:aquaporin Z